jgi:putative transposase
LRQGLEDSLQFHGFEDFNPKKISSTNMQERLYKEIRRCSRVVEIFPREESYTSCDELFNE